MTDFNRTQEVDKDKRFFGTRAMGMCETRPDGKVIRICMLDPTDPGCDDREVRSLNRKRAKSGSDALLAALMKSRFA